MAADQERADRIRQVRQDKHLRWKQIAAYVGVEMRSAQMWQETGAISWDNAVKLAELAGVDAHWLMSGAETNTPDLFNASGSTEDRLARIEEAVQGTYQLLQQASESRHAQQEEILDRIEALEAAILHNGDVVADRAVKRVRETIAKQQDAARRLEQMTQEAVEAMRSRPTRAPRKAPTGTRTGS